MHSCFLAVSAYAILFFPFSDRLYLGHWYHPMLLLPLVVALHTVHSSLPCLAVAVLAGHWLPGNSMKLLLSLFSIFSLPHIRYIFWNTSESCTSILSLPNIFHLHWSCLKSILLITKRISSSFFRWRFSEAVCELADSERDNKERKYWNLYSNPWVALCSWVCTAHLQAMGETLFVYNGDPIKFSLHYSLIHFKVFWPTSCNTTPS